MHECELAWLAELWCDMSATDVSVNTVMKCNRSVLE